MKRQVLTCALLTLSVALTACNDDSDNDRFYESKPPFQ